MTPAGAVTGSVLGTTYVARESIKRSLMEELPTEGGFLAGGAAVREETREAIADLVVQLEQLNPTETPARESLEGTWDVVWSGGLSPALIAAQALLRLPQSEFKSLVLEIGSKSTLVVSTALLSVGGSLDVRLTLRSRIEPESGVRIREQYELTGIAAPTLLNLDGVATAEDVWERVKGREFLERNLPQLGPFAEEAVKFLGGATQPILGWAGDEGVKLPLSGLYERVLYVTYMDDDTVVARDVSGAPSVLVRKTEDFVGDAAPAKPAAFLAEGSTYMDNLEIEPRVENTVDNKTNDDGAESAR